MEWKPLETHVYLSELVLGEKSDRYMVFSWIQAITSVFEEVNYSIVRHDENLSALPLLVSFIPASTVILLTEDFSKALPNVLLWIA